MTSRSATTVLLSLAALFLSSPASSVVISPGDVLYADLNGGTGVAVYRPSSGTTLTVASGNLIPRPAGVAVESQGSILVTNIETAGRVVRVNLANSAQAVVSEGGLIGSNPDGICMGPNNMAYVTSLQAGRIVEVNLATGAQRLVTEGGMLGGPIFIAVMSPDFLVTTSPGNGVIEVNITTGAQRLIANAGFLVTPEGLAVLPDGKILVADYETGNLVRVDPVSGAQNLVTSGLVGAWGLTLDGHGFAYVTRYINGTVPMVKVDLATGEKTNVTSPSAVLAFGVQVYFPSSDPPPPAPAPPPGFVASDNSPDGVILRWNEPTGQDGYRLYREENVIALLGSSDTSFVDVPPIGTYTYCIEAFNFGGVSPTACDDGTRRAFVAEPVLDFVRDVPADQGGRIALAWRASEYDSRITHAITSYRIWRRLPAIEVDSRRRALSTAGFAAVTRERLNGSLIEYWEPILTIPSGFREGYGAVVETTRDSLPDSNPYTAFLVSALTADPAVFYDSAIDSGYSVDDLAPPAPPMLAGAFHSTGEVRLSWRTPAAPDLGRYDVYRGPERALDPGRDEFLGSTPDTTFSDPSGGFYYYKVVAVDVHGNGSTAATLAPMDIPTPAWVLDASSEWNEGRLSIVVQLVTEHSWNRATVFRSSDPTFENAIVVQDDLGSEGAGRFRYEEPEGAESGARWYWMWITDGTGRLAMAGPVVVEPFTMLARTQVFAASPNPFRDEAAIAFVIGNDTAALNVPVVARIVDATGRRVRDLDLGMLSPGRHVLRWNGLDARGRLVGAGVYHMTLRIGTLDVHRRVVCLR
jgi:hypothetical protein